MSYSKYHKTRNQASAMDCEPVCRLDTVAAVARSLAAAASVDIVIAPEFTDYFWGFYIFAESVHTGDGEANGRFEINSVRIGRCDQEAFSSSQTATSVVLGPDAWQASECCYGRPVDWGPFSLANLSSPLRVNVTNISAEATDIYLSVAGRSLNHLPQGVELGKPCKQQAM